MSKQINVALIGNPNTGKTSVFNALTGLNQKVGNYPGITVEKKEGVCKLPRGVKAHIIDLPGTYSLNASSLDENVVIELLLNQNDKDFPDIAVVVTDVENLKRNLLLFTQIKDLQIPTLLVINMADRMNYKGISLDIDYLEEHLQTKIALISTRKNIGIDNLKQLIANHKEVSIKPCINISEIDPTYFGNLSKAFPNQLLYKLWLVITQDVNFGKTDRKEFDDIQVLLKRVLKLEDKEVMLIEDKLIEIILNLKDRYSSVISYHDVFKYLIKESDATFFGNKDLKYSFYQELYEFAYTLDLIDDTEIEELDFINAFTSPKPQILENKIRFSKNNYVVSYFLESLKIFFNGFTHIAIEKSEVFLNKQNKPINSTDIYASLSRGKNKIENEKSKIDTHILNLKNEYLN